MRPTGAIRSGATPTAASPNGRPPTLLHEAAPMNGAAAAAAATDCARPGQCLRWDDGTGCWWWADGTKGSLRAWSPDGMRELRCDLPGDAGGFALCRSGRLLVWHSKRLSFAAAPGMQAVQVVPHTRTATNTSRARGPRGWRLRALNGLRTSATLCAVDPAEPRTSIHDGRTDRRGFFVFGTRNDGADGRAIGSFYQYSAKHGLRRLALPAVSVAASICFSVDGRQMYFADGAKKRILQCDYDCETAGIANVRPFAETAGLPEASIVDRDGNLWNAQAGAGRLVRYAPDGGVLRQFALPRGGPASPAFGGSTGDQIVVASAEGLIAIAETGAGGLQDTRFDDQ